MMITRSRSDSKGLDVSSGNPNIQNHGILSGLYTSWLYPRLSAPIRGKRSLRLSVYFKSFVTSRNFGCFASTINSNSTISTLLK